MNSVTRPKGYLLKRTDAGSRPHLSPHLTGVVPFIQDVFFCRQRFQHNFFWPLGMRIVMVGGEARVTHLFSC
jgi:hypothetical protein